MSRYAKRGLGPAAPTPLQEIRRRRSEGVLITAAVAAAQAESMEWAMAAAAERAWRLMEEEVAERAGGHYDRWDGRQGYRNGTVPGYVVLGGRKVRVLRPRLCDASGRELALETYAALQDARSMDRTALGKVLEGVAQRKVRRGLERDQPLPEGMTGYGASKSSVSRRWAAATIEALAEQAERRLDDRRYLALLLDGKGFGQHLLVTAMGIDEKGRKAILGVWEGDGENSEVCTAALQELVNRGLDVRRGVLVVIDGGKGLAAAVRALWGDVAVVGRCRVHKRRNVLKRLSKGEQGWVRRALEQAWRQDDAEEAHTNLCALIAELEPKWPAAAASLREGLAETLTCQGLGLPPELIRAPGTTNLIERPCTQMPIAGTLAAVGTGPFRSAVVAAGERQYRMDHHPAVLADADLTHDQPEEVRASGFAEGVQRPAPVGRTPRPRPSAGRSPTDCAAASCSSSSTRAATATFSGRPAFMRSPTRSSGRMALASPSTRRSISSGMASRRCRAIHRSPSSPSRVGEPTWRRRANSSRSRSGCWNNAVTLSHTSGSKAEACV